MNEFKIDKYPDIVFLPIKGKKYNHRLFYIDNTEMYIHDHQTYTAVFNAVKLKYEAIPTDCLEIVKNIEQNSIQLILEDKEAYVLFKINGVVNYYSKLINNKIISNEKTAKQWAKFYLTECYPCILNKFNELYPDVTSFV